MQPNSNKGSIGGTSAAAIVCDHLGVRYFGRTVWHAYLRWAGLERKFRSTPGMQWGLRLERGILEWYAEIHRPGWVQYDGLRLAQGWRHGNLDSLFCKKSHLMTPTHAIVVDAKRAVMRRDEWGTDDEPQCPLGYSVQLGWYGLLAEREGYDVLSCDLAIYDPMADAEGRDPGHVRSTPWDELRPFALDWETIVSAAVTRWEAGQIPAWDGSDAASAYQASHHDSTLKAADREARMATADERAVIEAWHSARCVEKLAKAERKLLAQELIASADGKRVFLEDGAYVQPQNASHGGVSLGGHRFPKPESQDPQ